MNIPNIVPKKTALGLTAGLIGATAALILYMSGLLDIWELKTWDLRVNMMAKPAITSDRIRVIFLDQNSLDWGDEVNGLSWPWPREVYSAVIKFCQRGGARALVFDVLFSEPSLYGVDDDRALADSISDFNNFVGAVSLSPDEGSEETWPDYAPEPGFKVAGLDEWVSATNGNELVFPRASFPVEEISAAARILADVQAVPDRGDNVYRRAALFHIFDGRVLPSLALGAYLTAQPGTTLEIEPGYLKVGDRKIPIDEDGKAVLNFRGPSGTHDSYSAASVIESEILIQNGEDPTIDPAVFKDAYVFFGFSALGLFDLRPTPISDIYPGVEIYATMLDNLLANDFITPVPGVAVVAITLLMAIMAGLATSTVSGITRSAVVYIIFIIAPVIICLFAYNERYWLPLAVQETAMVITFFGSGLIYYTTEGRQKTFIKNAFRQYLSHAVIEELIRHPENLKLGGERRMLSIFFSDLEGFTTISEGLEPEALTALLNDYLTAMTDIIQEEGGTVDKYEGDAIIALWNAPVLQPDHAQRCVRAALRCQAKLAEMRPMFRERLGKDLRMRIGMNTGPAIVGNMGSHTRFDYTMIGDSVNLASRLEGINKQFGTYTIISNSTMEQMGGLFPSRELAKVAVVGRKEPVTVYEPMMKDEFEGRRTQFDRFAEGLTLFYRGDFSGAESVFSGLKQDDPVARSYETKCRDLIDTPPEDWKGVWVITTK